MGIAVDVFLDLECAAIGLHHDAEVYVQGAFFIHVLEVLLVAGLHIPSGILLIRRIHGGCKCGFHIFKAHETALAVYLGLGIAVLVNGHDGADSCGGRNAFVVGAEGGCNMDDTGTVTCGDIISGDYAESFSVWFEPGNELMIADTNKVLTLETAVKYLVGHNLVSLLIGFHGDLCTLGVEPGAKEVLGKDIHCRSAGVGVEREHTDILNLRAYAKGGV